MLYLLGFRRLIPLLPTTLSPPRFSVESAQRHLEADDAESRIPSVLGSSHSASERYRTTLNHTPDWITFHRQFAKS